MGVVADPILLQTGPSVIHADFRGRDARITLGALIFTMEIRFNNAIAFAEGMLERNGEEQKLGQVEDVAGKTPVPLLGATAIGILAFSGIGLSLDATGEFLFSFLAVLGISLLLLWLLAVTLTPLLGHYLFRRGDGT